jgi:uncharacterized repeat protein (TIGR03843 family)
MSMKAHLTGPNPCSDKLGTMDAGVDFAEVERLLHEAAFEDCRPLWYSSNYVYLARLCAEGRTFAAVYKPEAGESPLWDFPTGQLYRREVAAYRLSRLLDWNFVPPTIVRDGPHGIGAVQLYVEHDPRSHYFEQREDPGLHPQLHRIAVFDFIANNADRKGGHCLLDEHQRIWGIDHGLCFHTQYKLRTVMWDWAGESIAPDILEGVEDTGLRIAAETPEAAPLLEVVEPDEAGAMLSRMESLLASRSFPLPGPHRSYPWPLV